MHRDNRCMYMTHVCFYVCCGDCVGVCGNVCCVSAVVKDSLFLALECCSVLYVCVRGVMDVVSCVHPGAVLNAVFCMTCSLLILVEAARGDHMEEAYSRAGLMTAL